MFMWRQVEAGDFFLRADYFRCRLRCRSNLRATGSCKSGHGLCLHKSAERLSCTQIKLLSATRRARKGKRRRMIILPAIDIKDGNCVRLVKGDYGSTQGSGKAIWIQREL